MVSALSVSLMILDSIAAAQREGAGCQQLRTGQRQRMRSAAAGAEHLVDGDLSDLESLGAGDHVQPPGPLALGAGNPDRLVPVRLEIGDPVAQREGVVLAQGLDVAD